jgi:hypothetical protein
MRPIYFVQLIYANKKKQVQPWRLMPVILAIQRQRSGGSQLEACLGKQFKRPYLKNTQHKKELVECVKWQRP